MEERGWLILKLGRNYSCLGFDKLGKFEVKETPRLMALQECPGWAWGSEKGFGAGPHKASGRGSREGQGDQVAQGLSSLWWSFSCMLGARGEHRGIFFHFLF